MSPTTTVTTSSAHLDLTSSVTVHQMDSTATSPVETMTSYMKSDPYLSSFTISQNISPFIGISPPPSDIGEETRLNFNEGISIGIVVAVTLLVATAVLIIVVAVLVLVFHLKNRVQHKEKTIAGSVDRTIFNPGMYIYIYPMLLW